MTGARGGQGERTASQKLLDEALGRLNRIRKPLKEKPKRKRKSYLPPAREFYWTKERD